MLKRTALIIALGALSGICFGPIRTVAPSGYKELPTATDADLQRMQAGSQITKSEVGFVPQNSTPYEAAHVAVDDHAASRNLAKAYSKLSTPDKKAQAALQQAEHAIETQKPNPGRSWLMGIIFILSGFGSVWAAKSFLTRGIPGVPEAPANVKPVSSKKQVW